MPRKRREPPTADPPFRFVRLTLDEIGEPPTLDDVVLAWREHAEFLRHFKHDHDAWLIGSLLQEIEEHADTLREHLEVAHQAVMHIEFARTEIERIRGLPPIADEKDAERTS